MKKLLLEIFTWWNGQTLGTRMHTLINGRLVGSDLDGNKYFINKKNTESRWVIYSGKMDASKINANWHDWIHYRTDEIPVIDKNEKSYCWCFCHINICSFFILGFFFDEIQ